MFKDVTLRRRQLERIVMFRLSHILAVLRIRCLIWREGLKRTYQPKSSLQLNIQERMNWSGQNLGQVTVLQQLAVKRSGVARWTSSIAQRWLFGVRVVTSTYWESLIQSYRVTRRRLSWSLQQMEWVVFSTRGGRMLRKIQLLGGLRYLSHIMYFQSTEFLLRMIERNRSLRIALVKILLMVAKKRRNYWVTSLSMRLWKKHLDSRLT